MRSKTKSNYVNVQRLVDEDIRISDAKPDVKGVLCKRADARIASLKKNGEKLEVRGSITYQIMYLSDSPEGLKGELDFEEKINIPEEEAEKDWDCVARIDNFKVQIINDRKLNLRILLNLTAYAEGLNEVRAAKTEDMDSSLEVLDTRMEHAELVVDTRDHVKIRKDFEIQKDMPNISEIIWYDVDSGIAGASMKDEQLEIEENIRVQALYRCSGSDDIYMLSDSQNVIHNVDISGSAPDQIVCIESHTENTALEIRPDFDGEDRVMSAEVMQKIDIAAYEMTEIPVIEDAYSPKCRCEIARDNMCVQKVLAETDVKCRVEGELNSHPSGNWQAVCRLGRIRIEDTDIDGSNLKIYGNMEITVVCKSSEDGEYQAVSGTIPFEENIEIKGMSDYQPENVYVNICEMLDKIDIKTDVAGKTGIKAVANLRIVVMAGQDKMIVTDVKSFNDESTVKRGMPQIIGYMAKEGDTLWNIAKAHSTTIDNIKKNNPAAKENPGRGDKIILVR